MKLIRQGLLKKIKDKNNKFLKKKKKSHSNLLKRYKIIYQNSKQKRNRNSCRKVTVKINKYVKLEDKMSMSKINNSLRKFIIVKQI